jgi:hypothetical protein
LGIFGTHGRVLKLGAMSENEGETLGKLRLRNYTRLTCAESRSQPSSSSLFVCAHSVCTISWFSGLSLSLSVPALPFLETCLPARYDGQAGRLAVNLF